MASFVVRAAGICAVGFIITSQAAPKVKAGYAEAEAAYAEYMSRPVATASYEALETQIAAAKKRGQRAPANTDRLDEAMIFSAEYLNLRNELNGGPKFKAGPDGRPVKTEESFPGITYQSQNEEARAKTVAQMTAYFKKLNDKGYVDSLPPDARFAALQMAPLYHFRGILNRLIPLTKKHPVAQATVVTSLRGLTSSINVFLPTPQWKAGMLYLAYPQIDQGADIADDEGVRMFLRGTVLPMLGRMETSLESLNFSKDAIYFDNRMIVSDADFPDDQDRYVRVTEAERQTLLASVYLAQSATLSLVSYTLEGTLESMDRIGALFGVGARLQMEATDARSRFRILRSLNASKQFLVRRDDGQASMNKAFEKMRKAVEAANIAYSELVARGQDPGARGNGVMNVAQFNLFNPNVTIAGQRVLDRGFVNMKEILRNDGIATLSSSMVGNKERGTVRVDVKKFFTQSPQNLADFMPLTSSLNKSGIVSRIRNARAADEAGFNNSSFVMEAKMGRSTREWHNYLSGRPIAWDLDKWKVYFPDLKSNEDIPHAARMLSQLWGGWVISAPMSAFVL